MTSIPPSAKQCHRNERHGLYVGSSCPLCYRPGAANPVLKDFLKKDAPASAAVPPAAQKPRRSLAAPKLNKTEQRWQDAHPEHKPFAIRLRWGNCMNYLADFFADNGAPTLIEVKGAHIRDRDIVRFKGCAAEWGWLFDFELHQWKDGKWTQLY